MSSETQGVVKFWSTWAELCINMGEIKREMAGKTVMAPRVIRFSEGKFQTSDKEEIAAVRGAKYFGSKIFEEDPQDESDLAEIREAAAAIKAKKKGKSALAEAFTPSTKK